MEKIFSSGIIIFSILVFLVLVTGIVAMARGDKFNKNWSQRLMRMRVIFQAIVVLFIVVFFGLVRG
tara:strand:+ start:317 stop:514 length:198 start_codon:yes stop_codon:yes gene_type:complete